VPDIVPRRRVLLASVTALPLLLAAVGCRSQDVFAGPDPLVGRPPLGHDVLTLQAVIAAEEELVELYRTATTANPQATGRTGMLRPLLAQHEQHLAQLKARLIEPTGQAPTGPAARPSASVPGPASPEPTGLDLAHLRAAERASAASLVQRLATVSPTLAQLFASIAASDASHVMVLDG
jgi:hypothetical protein